MKLISKIVAIAAVATLVVPVFAKVPPMKPITEKPAMKGHMLAKNHMIMRHKGMGKKHMMMGKKGMMDKKGMMKGGAMKGGAMKKTTM